MLVNSNFNKNDDKYALKSEIPTTLPADGGNADTLDGLHANEFIKVNGHAGYDCNKLFDAGLYLLAADATNTPNDLKWGSLLVMPYRRPYGNGSPDYCAQIYIPNGDADDKSMWYRTSLQNTWNEWKKSCDAGNADTVDGLHANEIASNPNLLINPDFKINQRGGTSYTSSSANKYTVDRWIHAGTCTPTSTGVIVSADGSGYGYGVFAQILENYISGQTVTVSTKVNGNIYQFTGNTSESHIGGITITDSDSNNVGYIRMVTDSDNEKNTVEFIIYGGCQMEIEWVKLEYGNIATPFVPPDPTTELLKCKRYFEVINKSCRALSPDDIWIKGMIFDVPKRIIPSISITSSAGTPNTLSTYTGADSTITLSGMPNVEFDRINGSPCNQIIGYNEYSYICKADAEIY